MSGGRREGGGRGRGGGGRMGMGMGMGAMVLVRGDWEVTGMGNEVAWLGGGEREWGWRVRVSDVKVDCAGGEVGRVGFVVVARLRTGIGEMVELGERALEEHRGRGWRYCVGGGEGGE